MTTATSPGPTSGGTRERPPPRKLPAPGPLALVNPLAVAIKAGAATALALGLSKLLGNPDLVSAAFVAVLCTSPTVMMGLRQARDQLAGGLLGAVLGVGASLGGAPAHLGVPVAVSLGVGASFGFGMPQGYTAAAFSALFVQLVPMGDEGETLWVRVVALTIAATSGFAVNLLVSSHAYRFIFVRRLRRVEAHADKLLAEAPANGPRSVHPAFALVGQLERELEQTSSELRWRGNQRDLEWIEKVAARVEAIHHLLHLVWDLGLLCDAHDVPEREVAPLLDWARCGDGPRPEVPAPLAPGADRIVDLWRQLRELRVSFPAA